MKQRDEKARNQLFFLLSNEIRRTDSRDSRYFDLQSALYYFSRYFCEILTTREENLISERYFRGRTMYFAMSKSTPDFFSRRLKPVLCAHVCVFVRASRVCAGASIRWIIDNVEACHLAEWEQEQPLCLFLLAPLSRLIKYSAPIPRFPLPLPLLSLLSLTALLLLKIPLVEAGCASRSFNNFKVNKIQSSRLVRLKILSSNVPNSFFRFV